ncbi:hypothetical protein M3Y97_00143900 [Aphelenchoides bicaudatus]|nr:hypothetical protein M3Y97_00143900 [Aphelenchoides bicaudatus]
MPLAEFEKVSIAVAVAVGVSVALTVILAFMAGCIAFYVKKTCVPLAEKTASVLSTPMESLDFSQIPMSIIAVMAAQAKITLEDIGVEYANDASKRRTIVLQSFKKDAISDAFIDDYDSKFLQHGYVGEGQIQI